MSVCVAKILREIFAHIFVQKNQKGNKRLTFCAVCSGVLVDRSIQNWEAAVDNMTQLLQRTCAPAHVTCVSVKLASQSKPSASLCQGALRQIRHPEGSIQKAAAIEFIHPPAQSYQQHLQTAGKCTQLAARHQQSSLQQ